MTPNPPLRPTETGSADVEPAVVLRGSSPVLAAALVAAAAAVFLAVVLLAGIGRLDTSVPGFLEQALGPEKAEAPLERTPATGIDVRIHDQGYTVSHWGASVSVVSEDVGGADWRRHVHGVTRETDFGTETIVVDGRKTEEFLTVVERQGDRTWRWKLATRLQPRLSRDGAISFFDPTRHVVTGISIDPVRILDDRGKEVTPDGLSWGLEEGDSGWWLTLELDDADLPLPYVIDPAANYPQPLVLRNGATAVTGTWDWGTTTGAVDTTTDNIPASGQTGWYAWNPGVSNTTRLAAIPTTTDGTGWMVDPVGGATGFPAGNWSFTVVTDIPNGTFVAGAAVLTVGLWKGTVAGSAFTPTATILTPSDDPVAQNLRVNVNPTTTTVTFSLPAFSLAAGETLFVDFWRHQTNGIASATTARRQLDFYVNDGNAFVSHPAADDVAPSHSLSVTELTNPGGQYFDATTATQFYSTAVGGTFRVDDAATDAGSGVASVTFPALAATGFTHAAVTDTTSPYQSNTYTWTTANTTSPGAQAVSAVDSAFNTSNPSPQLTFTRDVTAPSGQTLSLVGGPYYTSTSVSLTAGDGSDSGSGLDTSSRVYERDSATLANGSCGAFSGSWTTVSNPDTTVASGNCYRYRYSIADNVGNRSATVTASVDAKVDSSAPAAPSLSLAENPADADQHVSGTTLYYRPGANGGTFRVTASAADAQSGIASVAFPSIANVTGGGTDASSPYEMDYSWGASTAASGSQNVTAQNNAGTTSANGPFTLSQDSTAPSGQTLSLVGGPYYTSTSVSLTAGDGSDSGSGLDTSSRVYERDSATLANGSCGAFSGSWTTVSNPDTTVASGNCYRYRYSIADNVGNRSATVTASVDAKVDSSAPAAPSLSLAENPADADQHVSGTTLYYRPGANGGTFRVTASAADAQSGIASVAFPSIANVTGGGTDASSPYEMDYSWGASTAASGSQNVTAQNNAGTTSANGPFTLSQDSTAPSGQTLSLVGGPYYTSTSVSLTAGDGSDSGSGLDTSSRVYERDSATLANGSCGAFSGSWTTVSNPDTTVASGNCYRYRYSIADNVGNRSATVTASVDAKVDSSAPAAPSLSLAENPADADQHVSGTTLYYRPGANGGTFRVTASAADAQSGIASVAFPSIANVTGGGTDASSPYEMDYSWGASTAASGSQNVTAQNNAGTTSANGPFTLSQDSTAPSGQTLSLVGGPYYTSTSVSLTAGDGSDSGSGLDTSSRVYERDSATLANGSCGAFSGSWTTVSNPDTTVASGNCYRYRYSIADNVGNRSATVTASVDAKVDSSAPAAPSLSLAENPADADQHVSGTTLYYRPGANGGTFRVTASAADAQSGIASVAFPSIANVTGGGTDASSPYEMDYSWGASTAASGSQNVTAQNNAGTTSANGPFTLSQDSTAPSGQTLSLVGGPYYTSTSVSLTAGDGSDSGSGLDTSSRVYERDSATLANGSCGAFSGSWTTVSNPDTTVASGNCYRYRYSIADNVGNRSATVTASVDAKVDSSAPAAPSLSLAENPADADQHVSGTTLYYRPGANGGTFRVTASAADAQSGIASVAFPSIANVTGGGTDASSPYEMDYSWGASTAASGSQNVTAQNNAGTTSANGPFTLSQDGSVPSTNDDTASIGSGWKTSAQVVTLTPLDGGSGVAATYYTTDGSTPTTASTEGTTINLIADGVYTIKYFSVDNVGNAESVRTASTQIHLDQTDPSSAVLDALPGAIRNGQALTGSGADTGSGVDSITYLYCSGTSCAPATSIGSSSTGPDYSVTWSSMPADGDVRVLARVTDAAGNTLDSAIQDVVVDNTNPTGSLTAPSDAAFVAGSVQVSSNSADSGSGVASAQFERRPAGGGSWTSIGTDPSSPYSVSWDTTFLADGDYDLRVVTSDEAGNTFTSGTRTVTVDNSSPSVSIVAPTGFVNGGSPDPFTMSATTPDADVDQVEFFRCSDASAGCGSGTWVSLGTDPSPPYSASWPIDADGNRALRAVVTDHASNTGADVVDVTIDRTDPTGSLTAPADGAYLVGTISVSSNSADSGSGVASAQFERRPAGGGAWTSIGTDPSSPYSASWDTTSLADGDYDLRVVTSDEAGNTFTSGTRTVTVDNSAPSAPVVSLSETSPHAFVSGTEIFVDTDETGSYDVDATSSDSHTGIEKMRFPGPTDDFSSPYQASYGFGDLSGAQTVTAFNGAGLTASSPFTVTPDTAEPTGGSVDYPAGYDADGTVTITVDAGSDALSGVAPASAVLERRTSSLSDGACEPFTGAWSAVTSPDTVGSALCAQYRFRVSDRVGNEAVYTSAAVVKVDLGAPAAPALSLVESSPYAHVVGTEIFVNTNETGTYDVQASTSDAVSGIEKVVFPGGVEDTTSPYEATYDFDDLLGTETVSAHDRAGNSTSSDFEVTEDISAPSTTDDTASVGSAWQTAPVTVALTPTDARSGIAHTYYTTDGSVPTTGSDEGTSIDLTADGVYVIRYFSVDRVGNVEPIRTAVATIRIDKTSPSSPSITLGESSPFAHVVGSEIFVNTNETGSFGVSATSVDATSGIDRISFPAGIDDTTSPYSTTYDLDDLSGSQTVTAHDVAGNTASDTFTVTPDTAPPTGGSVDYADGYDADGTVTITVDAGSDALSGVAPASAVLERQTSALVGGTCDPFAGGWSTVTSPDTVPDSTCARYRYRVSDHVGNEATYTLPSSTVKVDLTAPETTIDVAPSGPSSDASPSFEFSSDEPGSTFECRLDGGSWNGCTSPETLSGLSDGNHTFRVRATDGAGLTDATPATYTWTIDTAPPNTFFDDVPPDPSNDDAPSFEFSANEPGATFECRLDGGAWGACSSPETIGLLLDGSHTFEVQAIDGAGNVDGSPASHTWTVDTVAPQSSFSVVPADPSNDATPTFAFAANEAGSSLQCRLDGGAWGSCTSPETVGPLADGSHTYEVRATDAAGNQETAPASYTWVVDAGAPTVTITQPSGFVNAADADPYTVRATSSDGDVADVAFFRCSDDSAGCSTGTWISLGTDATAPYEASWPLDADGNRALRAVATDTASNTGANAVDVTIDRTVPTTSIDSAPSDPSGSTSASFEFSADEGGTSFECRLDAGSWGSCSSPQTYSSLAEGNHTFHVRATDAAGNVDPTPATFTWSVDTVAPQTTIDDAPSDPSSDASPSFEFSSNEPGSTFECRLDGGAWGACSSPHGYVGLADGSHTFRVRAIDPAANVDGTPATHTWTIDATPPGGGLADPGQFLRGTIALSASPSDTGVGIQSVAFQVSPAGAGTWSSIDLDTTAPYGVAWDTTTLADGAYDLRIVVTDNASNSSPSAVVEDRIVDNTAPGATMNDPGAYLHGTVPLTADATDAGSGIDTVAFQRSPAGAGSWTAVSDSWNTTGVVDGLYDLRVIVTDNAGNSTTSAAVTDRRVDNTKPNLTSSTPSDGSTLASASSLEVVASEDVAGIVGAEIDGSAAPAPSISGDTVTYTMSFSPGPHMLAGELEDLAGNRQPIRVHFTTWTGTTADYPYVEKNSFSGSSMSLRSTSDTTTVTVPAGAWTGAPAGDWLVLRIDPQAASGGSGGFQPASEVLDVTAYWALAGGDVTSFSLPLEIEVDNAQAHVIPAVLQSGVWRALAEVPGSGLPAGWDDGFAYDGSNIRILTRHLSVFTLLVDAEAPSVPGKFRGTVNKKNGKQVFTLRWTAATDNSDVVSAYQVYTNGTLAKTVDGTKRAIGMGAFKLTDKRSFQVTAVDAAGNVGPKSKALKVIPKVARLSLAAAKASLKKRGFKAGAVSYRFSATVPAGKVTKGSAAGLRPAGSKIGLTVSKGRAGAPRPVTPTTTPPTFGATTNPPPATPSTPAQTAPPPPVATPAPTTTEPTAMVEQSFATRGGRVLPFTQQRAEGFSELRHELGFGLLAAAFSIAVVAILRARRPAAAPPAGVDDQMLLWDTRIIQAIRRLLHLS